MTDIPDVILGLDVGEKRIGVAIASTIARLPSPLVTLANDGNFLESLKKLITRERVGALVIGFPRGLDGQTTQQTAAVESFIGQLKKQIDLPIYTQDEALTSQKAETELHARGNFNKADVDALAAAFILEDFLTENATGGHV